MTLYLTQFFLVCLLSVDMTQSIPVYLIFVSWYDPVFDPVRSSLFVISWHDPVHSSLSVLPVCMLFQHVCYSSVDMTQSIPVCLLFQYVSYSSVDMTQSPSLSVIPVGLLFIIWYYTVHSGLSVIQECLLFQYMYIQIYEN